MSPPRFSPPQLPLPRPPQAKLPTMYDLPSEYPNEPGVPDEFHIWQPELLSSTFRPPDWETEQVFGACDLHLYYDWQHPLRYKRPDWFGAVGVSRLYRDRDLRRSYVAWDKAAAPSVVVELLSPSTRDEDLGQRAASGVLPRKWDVYEQFLAIPYYITFDRLTDELRVFRLEADRYAALPLTEPRVWLPELNLGLGLWHGEHCYCLRSWLYWYGADGGWLPTEAEEERQRAETERQRAETERQRAERLAARLRELGLDPDAP